MVSNPTWDETTPVESAKTPTWDETAPVEQNWFEKNIPYTTGKITGRVEQLANESGIIGQGVKAFFTDPQGGVRIPIATPLAERAAAGIVSATTDKTYEDVRNQQIADRAKFVQENPGTAMVGEGLGAAVPGIGAGMGGLAGVATRIGANTAIGAASNALEAPEGQKLEAAKSGALWTGIPTALLEGAGPAGKALGWGANKLRVLSAHLSKGEREAEVIGEVLGKGRTVSQAIESNPEVFEGATNFTAKGAFDKAEKLKETTGQKIGELVDSADQELINSSGAESVVNHIKNVRLQKDFQKILDNTKDSAVKARTLKIMEDVDSNLSGNNIFRSIADEKSRIYKMAGERAYSQNLEDTVMAPQLRAIAAALKNELEYGVEQLGAGPQPGKVLKELNNKYRDLSLISDQFLSASASKPGLGGLSYVGTGIGTAITGLSHGNVPMIAVGAATAANAFPFMQILEAKAASGGAKYLDLLNKTAKEGPQAVAVAHYMLSQKDPEYQKLINDKE